MLTTVFAGLFLFHSFVFAADSAAPEIPKPKGAIAGTVSEDSGTPAAGVKVEAFSCVDGLAAASAVSGQAGAYTIPALADGCYHVRFSGAGFESSWRGKPQYRDTAEEVKVNGGAVTGIDATVSPSDTTISGVVKAVDGTPLPGAWVTAVLPSEKSEVSLSDGVTDAKGAYSVNVSSGKHVVLFAKKGYSSEIYGGSLTNPTRVEALAEKPAAGIDGILTRGGSIAGSVKNEAGKGLPGIIVAAIAPGSTSLPVGKRTDAEGNFVLDGLATGKYWLMFSDQEETYLPQWYDGKTGPDGATVVPVTAPNATSGIRAVLRTGGSISGRVTDPAGNPVAGAAVMAESTNTKENGFGYAATDPSGNYTIHGLAGAKYLVSFRARGGTLLSRYYRDSAAKDAAAPVEVVAGQATSNIDQMLPQGRTITGSVKNGAGEPVHGASVQVVPAEKESKVEPVFGQADENGAFTVAVPDGNYLVQVRAQGYLPQWSGNRPERKDAAVIPLSKDQATAQADFVLVRGGSISGTVRNRAGAPIAGVRVSASEAATGERGDSGTSDAEGRYTIMSLRVGNYRLSADGSTAGYVETKLPQPVAIAETGAQAENVDFVLFQGGEISGRVTDPDGNPVLWMSVAAYDPVTWDEIGSTSTEMDGRYRLAGLPEGKYSIRFEQYGSKYPVQWYKKKFKREEAAQVDVSGTAAVTGVDTVMVPGMALSGTVTDTNGGALADTKVEVYGGSEDEPFATTNTDSGGKYTVAALAPGFYRLRFSHEGFVPRWTGGSDRRSATPVRVGDSDLAGINAALVKASGTFSGKLMNPEGHKVGQAWLTVLDAASGAAVADERICECNGLFDTPVPGGWYRIRVERHGQVFWYRGTSQEDAATLPGSGAIGGLDMVIDDSGVKNKQAQELNRQP
nr:carboxypeptidase-like regulatory domain-containing protein [Geomonas sp. Red32]